MLLHCDLDRPIYFVGTSVFTQELVVFVQQEYSDVDCRSISKNQYFDLPDNSQCMIGFLNLSYRINFLQESQNLHRQWPTYLHPDATVVDKTNLGKGIIVGPQSVVGHGVCMGDFCTIGQLVSIGHGTSMGQNCVVPASIVIGGSCDIGNNVIFGQSSSIKDKITIVDNCKFAMNSVVTKDINESGNYYGNKRANIEF
jgi:acyl-[acyl carrier protein]--UDP-N-acetylglucosamine O-acyltransferase